MSERDAVTDGHERMQNWGDNDELNDLQRRHNSSMLPFCGAILHHVFRGIRKIHCIGKWVIILAAFSPSEADAATRHFRRANGQPDRDQLYLQRADFRIDRMRRAGTRICHLSATAQGDGVGSREVVIKLKGNFASCGYRICPTRFKKLSTSS